MHPEVCRNSDGSITLSLTLPPATASQSLLRAEEAIMDAHKALGCEAVRHTLGGFDSDGTPFVREGRNWTSKGRFLKIYETPWGEVPLERHLYQSSAGGCTWCPLEEQARIVGGTATPHLARSLSHRYVNKNARAVARDLRENHGRTLYASQRLTPNRAGTIFSFRNAPFKIGVIEGMILDLDCKLLFARGPSRAPCHCPRLQHTARLKTGITVSTACNRRSQIPSIRESLR
jgi:hypothetical protein